jgi:hypothetical protein
MKFAVLLLLLSLTVPGAVGQEGPSEDTLKAILDEALQINITAHLLPPNQKGSVNFEKSKLTIPGRPVAVRIKGGNILINATLTPYQDQTGKLILVAQGQIWYTEADTESRVQYHSSLKSIPVSLGERVFFFPLGRADDISAVDSFNIVLEIEINSFKSP